MALSATGGRMRDHLVYVITAQVLTHEKAGDGSWQVPTFYLDSAIQGITDHIHAIAIAKQVIDPMGTLELSIHAEPRKVAVTP
jgi:hypothetical protein